MSEDTKPKINLKALKPLENTLVPMEEAKIGEVPLSPTAPVGVIQDSKIGIPAEGKEETSPMKISLGMIKKPITPPLNIPIKIETSENTSNVQSNSPGEKEVQKEMGMFQTGTMGSFGEAPLEAPSKEILAFIESQKEEKEVEKEAVAPIQFQNYESGFKKQSSNVLKRIQNFRYTPKTRTGFLLGLSVLCFGSIALMMVLFPEKHSFSVYKASILSIIESEEILIVPEDIIVSPENPTPPLEEEIPTEEENPSPPNENDETGTQVRQEKKEKLRQHLLKKYSS